MAAEIKRMRFFDGLFLKQEEFNQEQEYQVRMRRMHNRHLHGNGIAWGLNVVAGPGPGEVTIKPGMGIDKHFDTQFAEETGREVAVVQDTIVELATIYGADSGVYVWLTYNELQADIVPDRGGSEPIHYLETFTVGHGLSKPDEEQNLLLAKVNIPGSAVIDAAAIVTEENGVSLRTPINEPTQTIVQGGGDSFGKNYVKNSDAEVDTAEWTDSSSLNLTVGRTDVTGDVLSGTWSFQINGSAGIVADTDYITIALDNIDEEDKQQLFAVEFSVKGGLAWDDRRLKVIVRDTTNNIDIMPNPMFLPAGQGKYRGVFTTTSSRTYELRLVVAESAVAFSVILDSVKFGPNLTAIGPAIGGWIDAGPMVITGTQGNPTPGGVIVNKISYRRVGDTMEFAGQFHQDAGGSDGTGRFYFDLPGGYHAAQVAYESNGTLGPFDEVDGQKAGSNTWGTATIHVNGVKGASGAIQFVDSRRFTTTQITTGGSWTMLSNSVFNFSSGDFNISFHGSVPIAEWSNDVILSESRVEYVYNSDLGDGHDTTSFATGEEGGIVPSIAFASTGSFLKRVKFSRPFKHVRLEVKPHGTSGTGWMDLGSSFYAYHQLTDNTGRGMMLAGVGGSEQEFQVHFASGGVHLDGVFSNDWATEASLGTRYRVVGCDNPLFVETAPRQFVSAESDEHTPIGSNIWFQMTNNSVLLQPGAWRVSAYFGLYAAGTTNYDRYDWRWTTVNGDNSASTPPLLQTQAGPSSGSEAFNALSQSFTKTIPEARIRVTTPTTVYFALNAGMATPSNGRVTVWLYAERME